MAIEIVDLPMNSMVIFHDNHGEPQIHKMGPPVERYSVQKRLKLIVVAEFYSLFFRYKYIVMGVLLWFINQLITGGRHPIES